MFSYEVEILIVIYAYRKDAVIMLKEVVKSMSRCLKGCKVSRW